MIDVLRLIAGGLLALVCCYIGLLIKRRYRDRAEFYKSASEYARAALSDLSLNKAAIPDIAKKFAMGRNGEFERVLTESVDIVREGKDLDYAFEKINVRVLKADEKKELLSFLCKGGKSALNDQLSFVGYYKDIFEQKQKKCEQESKKLGGTYFKLCVLLGLAIMLILA